MAGVLVVMLLATELSNTEFLSEQGVKDLLLNATILALVATGQAVVVITRNVDLSVGSVLGISAFAAGDYLQGGGSSVLAVLYAVAVGAVFGVLNGALVSLGKVPALVVTLGTLYVVRGIDSIWVGSDQIVAADSARRLRRLRSRRPLGRPTWRCSPSPSCSASATTCAATAAAATCTRSAPAPSRQPRGRPGPQAHHDRLRAVRRARRTRRRPIPGPLRQRRLGHRRNGYELTVVSAVVVGGVAFTGGSGTVCGAALGALLLTSINSVLPPSASAPSGSPPSTGSCCCSPSPSTGSWPCGSPQCCASRPHR